MSEMSYTDRDREIDKVEDFGRLMIRRLDEHAEKGRLGWQDIPVIRQFVLVVSEAGELADAIHGVDFDDPTTVQPIIDECGDLANRAMMIVDNLGGLND